MVPRDPDDAPRAEGDERRDDAEPEELLTPSEVAAMFRVNPKTVTRWHRTGKVSAIRTLGGHRRFRASEIRRLLAEGEQRTD
jgi:excisionase family DNA binding protein